MGRRTFINRLLTGISTIPLMGMLPADTLQAATGGDAKPPLHYRPLNGASLRDIAGRKLHHGNGRFTNPLGIPRDGRFLELMRWKFFSANQFGDYLGDQPVTPLAVDWEKIKDGPDLSITFLKHAGLSIKDGDAHLLIDPIFDDIFWFIEDFSPLSFRLEDMPKPDTVLITHGHFDHLDLPTLGRLDQDTRVISPLGYDAEFDALGMQRRTQLDWFDTVKDGPREITFLPANHWTMRSPIVGPNTSLWGGYLIRTSGGYTIYVSGDTAYFEGFDQIGDAYNIDLAIINVGAYEPRWFMAPSHMDPQETVAAFKQLNAKKLMVVHWGSFRLGDEPIHFPPQHMRAALAKENLLDRWVDLGIGQTYFPA
jgi:L-ascorbate metabolism protein UlaG (beta-lactamase superfamily)